MRIVCKWLRGTFGGNGVESWAFVFGLGAADRLPVDLEVLGETFGNGTDASYRTDGADVLVIVSCEASWRNLTGGCTQSCRKRHFVSTLRDSSPFTAR